MNSSFSMGVTSGEPMMGRNHLRTLCVWPSAQRIRWRARRAKVLTHSAGVSAQGV